MKVIFRILYKSLLFDRPQTLAHPYETYEAAENEVRELLASSSGSLFSRMEYWIEKVYVRDHE